MRTEELAELVVAPAVSDIVDTFFPGVAADRRAELLQELRAFVLSAVWTFHSLTCRKVRRARADPSDN